MSLTSVQPKKHFQELCYVTELLSLNVQRLETYLSYENSSQSTENLSDDTTMTVYGYVKKHVKSLPCFFNVQAAD